MVHTFFLIVYDRPPETCPLISFSALLIVLLAQTNLSFFDTFVLIDLEQLIFNFGPKGPKAIVVRTCSAGSGSGFWLSLSDRLDTVNTLILICMSKFCRVLVVNQIKLQKGNANYPIGEAPFKSAQLLAKLISKIHFMFCLMC